ncbi:hypothetical protein AMR42_07955 [Limnothrix sp. PR1529]|uniref:hypothetical protein n=1 Tax=Limnothrix sp. PR1529 TaxID=1704291 RepID=UPI00081F4704|nr:hypothetical protein [Limnothrix sp. PR1529]OCQ95119.1 hypothetical protein BCR12_06915 [Limnothrix sp. P13C2]PIB14001.1 hypothetical protein AMR42_07955 [Limnothrix sp. PR1529]
MLWTYRVFRDRQGRHSIREIFCDRNHQILKISPAPVTVVGSSAEDLLQLIQWFKEAFELPILSLEEIETQIAQKPPNESTTPAQKISLQQLIADRDNQPNEQDTHATA